MPFSLKTEMIGQEKLQDILMGKITLNEAHELKARMMDKRKRKLTIIILCVMVFVFCICSVALYDYFMLPDDFILIALVVMGFSLVFLVFQLPGLVVAKECLSVLKYCHPDSHITFTEYRTFDTMLYNKLFFKNIKAHIYNSDEAYGILNMANYNRKCYLGVAVFCFIVGAAMAMLSFFTSHFMAMEGGSDSELQFMLNISKVTSILLCLGALMQLYRRLICKRFIHLIETTYTEEGLRKRESLIEGIITALKEETLIPSISLATRREATTVYSSKLGGTPYLPPDFEYPKSASGKPLHLLAQLNFEELPKLPDFPEKGILQFYAENNDLYGMNIEALNKQKYFRIIYHSEIIENLSILEIPPYMESEKNCFPFEGEFKLCGEIEQTPISSLDYRFYEKALSLYKTAFINKTLRMHNDIYDRLNESFNAGRGHRMNGYPYFNQTDPRSSSEPLKEYTILLLQIDSTEKIIWKNNVVANFFITPEQLKAKDFSNVIYTWDCL